MEKYICFIVTSCQFYLYNGRPLKEKEPRQLKKSNISSKAEGGGGGSDLRGKVKKVIFYEGYISTRKLFLDRPGSSPQASTFRTFTAAISIVQDPQKFLLHIRTLKYVGAAYTINRSHGHKDIYFLLKTIFPLLLYIYFF